MSSFDVELRRLIEQWLARGDDAKSMIETMEQRADDMRTMLASLPTESC